MKWISHSTVTGVIVYAVTEDLMLTASAMVGAIVPDKIEGSPQQLGFSSWRSRHRGYSHWFPLYLILIAATAKLAKLYTPLAEGAPFMIYFCVGAMLHIAEDAICGKVPFILPAQKIGIKLFKVGSFREYLISVLIILIVYAAKLGYNFIS